MSTEIPRTGRAVYGLFNGPICEYVGSTFDPLARKRQHRRGLLRENPTWTFVVLVKACLRNHERRILKYYKSIGQAAVNRNAAPKRLLTSPDCGTLVKCSNGMLFPSQAAMARFLGVSVSTVRNIFTKYGCKEKGLTFELLR